MYFMFLIRGVIYGKEGGCELVVDVNFRFFWILDGRYLVFSF